MPDLGLQKVNGAGSCLGFPRSKDWGDFCRSPLDVRWRHKAGGDQRSEAGA